MTTLFLPFPPSTNGLFPGKQRRFKSPAYKAWLKEAADDLKFQKYTDGFKWKNHTGQVKITIMLKSPDKRKRDLDNLAKAVMDFLVDNNIITGDDFRYVRSLYMMWNDEMKDAGCFVIVEDVEN